jgi:hypothetical protein
MPDTRTLRRLTTGLSISAALVLGACNSMPETSSGSTSTAKPASVPAYQPVTDVPIPAGSKINTERSLILGQGDKWVGRMVLVVDKPSTQTYTYYEEQMPKFGWEQVSAVQGKNSIMTFTRGDRAATVDIVSSTFSGSEVSLTVSPRNAGGAAAAGAPAAAPATPEKK